MATFTVIVADSVFVGIVTVDGIALVAHESPLPTTLTVSVGPNPKPINC